jgi:hypothetical protein
MTDDEEYLLTVLYDRALPGKRPSVIEAQMQNLPDWDKDRVLIAAQGLERDGYILNARGPLVNVDLSSTARKYVSDLRKPAPAQSINIGTNSNSPIQQLGDRAVGTQSVTYNISRDDLQQVVALFRDHGSELNLDPRAQRQTDSYVATIEAQLEQDKPNPVIVREAGKSLKTIAEGAIGSIIAAGATNLSVWQWLLSLPF